MSFNFVVENVANVTLQINQSLLWPRSETEAIYRDFDQAKSLKGSHRKSVQLRANKTKIRPIK